jgi:NADH-quinone oxidoreductase subunit C
MFGIFFFQHFDLRRILTDYGFKGFPLRKDFPLTGFRELYFNENKKRLIYKKLILAQEYRLYNFRNPWNLIN